MNTEMGKYQKYMSKEMKLFYDNNLEAKLHHFV